MPSRNPLTPRERRLLVAAVALLVGLGAWFRVWRLATVPGLSGDEGWWGLQALAWLADQPYQARTTSGNPIDLLLLIPIAWLHAVAAPSFALLRTIPVAANLL